MIFLWWLACGGSALPFDRSPTKIREAIEPEIPIGASPEAASRQLEWKGFTCSPLEHGNFIAESPPVTRENIDFLRCTEIPANGVWSPALWTVAVVVEDNAVRELLIGREIVMNSHHQK